MLGMLRMLRDMRGGVISTELGNYEGGYFSILLASCSMWSEWFIRLTASSGVVLLYSIISLA